MKKILVIFFSLWASLANAQNPGITTQGSVISGNTVLFVNRNLVRDSGSSSTGCPFTLTGDVTSVGGSCATTLKTVNSNVGTFGNSTNIGAFTVNAKGLIISASNISVSIPVGANPTATIGTSAVNGSASTFMRSDAAPAFGNLTGQITSVGMVTTLITTQPDAHTWQKPQAFNPDTAGNSVITSTGGSNTGSNATSMVDMSWTLNTSGSPDVIAYRITDTARGASTKLLNIYGGASGTTSLFAIDRFGDLILGSTSGISGPTFDIGFTSGTRSWISGSFAAGGSAGSPLSFLTNVTTATWQFGAANAASPVAQTLQAQGSRAGTDSNVSGAGLTITSGNGTGNSTVSTLTLQSPVAVASGTGTQTQTTGWRINNGTGVSTGYTVAGLPATALTGARAHVTDQLTTCAGIGVALTGGGAVTCPAFYNGAAWVGG